MSGVVTIGLDPAKSIFQIQGVDGRLALQLTTGRASSLALATPFG
jgi:hypothetical protein